MVKQEELRAAAARLMYNDNRDIRDYNALIAFIDDNFREPQTVADEIRGASDNKIAAELTGAMIGGMVAACSAFGIPMSKEKEREAIEAAIPKVLEYIKRPATKQKKEEQHVPNC